MGVYDVRLTWYGHQDRLQRAQGINPLARIVIADKVEGNQTLSECAADRSHCLSWPAMNRSPFHYNNR